MLSERYTREWLERYLLPAAAFHPYPVAAERHQWESLPAVQRIALIEAGIQANSEPWPLLTAQRYLDYARDGNRRRYEEPLFKRRAQLRTLVLAECVEGQGRFLDAVVNGIWLTCEESSWCLPAHVGAQRAGVGLPDVTEPIPDLFCGEAAALLAWSRYLLKDALDGVSPLISQRIADEIRKRFLAPCAERDHFFWMGFRNPNVNNWNPWINSNWLACILLLEDEPGARAAAAHRSLTSVDAFIRNYPPDGGCDEGPAYWGRAAASLFDWLELAAAATEDRLNVFDEPLIRNMGAFIAKVHISDSWMLNFADAPARVRPCGSLVYRFGTRVNDPYMRQFGAWLDRQRQPYERLESLGRLLPALFGMDGVDTVDPAPPLLRDVFLPDTQVMAARACAGSDAGLFLAAKGGHNAESHNHNDVGHFVVFSDGRPVIIDAGVGEYTAKTFSARRYEIWSMQSNYHNLPVINGIGQSPGREFEGRILDYTADDDTAAFALELRAAYPAELGIRHWHRSFQFKRTGSVTVTDDWELDQVPRQLELILMTPCRVAVESGRLRFAAVTLPGGMKTGELQAGFSPDTEVATEVVVQDDSRLAAVWGESLTRIILRPRPLARIGQFKLVFDSRSLTQQSRNQMASVALPCRRN